VAGRGGAPPLGYWRLVNIGARRSCSRSSSNATSLAQRSQRDIPTVLKPYPPLALLETSAPAMLLVAESLVAGAVTAPQNGTGTIHKPDADWTPMWEHQEEPS
jgi:hypothetical protein